MLRSVAVTVACLLGGVAAAAAGTGSARVRWRGVAVEGRAPAAFVPAVAAHVAVALRSLGSTLVTSPPEDAEAAASCAFPSSAKIARCFVVVKVGSAARAERRQEIRYRDAEDLAESLALLVSDILTSEFPDIVGGAHVVPPPQNPPSQNPPPQNPQQQPPPPPPTLQQQKAHEAEMQRQLEIVRSLQKQADEARAARERDEQRERQREQRWQPAPPRLPKPTPPTRVAVELGADGSFGLGTANPTLVGGAARVVYSRALLRVGASLSLTGMRETLGGHDLSFVRGLVAARAGVGFRGAVVDFDLTGGPALLVLVEDAHTEGRHAVGSLAFVAGPHLAFAVSGPLAIIAGADFALAVTDEKVTADGARVAQFSRGSVDVTLGLAWRSR